MKNKEFFEELVNDINTSSSISSKDKIRNDLHELLLYDPDTMDVVKPFVGMAYSDYFYVLGHLTDHAIYRRDMAWEGGTKYVLEKLGNTCERLEPRQDKSKVWYKAFFEIINVDLYDLPYVRTEEGVKNEVHSILMQTKNDKNFLTRLSYLTFEEYKNLVNRLAEKILWEQNDACIKAMENAYDKVYHKCTTELENAGKPIKEEYVLTPFKGADKEDSLVFEKDKAGKLEYVGTSNITADELISEKSKDTPFLSFADIKNKRDESIDYSLEKLSDDEIIERLKGNPIFNELTRDEIIDEYRAGNLTFLESLGYFDV